MSRPSASALPHPGLQTPVPPDHLRDESRRSGRADAIAFPRNVAEAAAVLRLAAAEGRPVTVQGARTGIAAGAVPDGGVVLSLSRMDRLLGARVAPDGGTAWLRVQPGLRLSALRQWLAAPAAPSDWDEASRQAVAALRARRWFFPPDPTETSASIGGMIACNASGACSFAHGPTRPHVSAVTVLLADGERVDLRRGEAAAAGRHFELVTAAGRAIAGELPDYRLPAVKNAAGYGVRPDMDLLDLFVGGEGTLGVVVEAEIRLQPAPRHTWGVMVFLPGEAAALDLVPRLRAGRGRGEARLLAIEYFDAGALELLRAAGDGAIVAWTDLAPEWAGALYVEWAGEEEAPVAAAAAGLQRLLVDRGLDPRATWVAADAASLQRLKTFRHAVPEEVNRRIALRQRVHPGVTKLGTDLSVPDACFGALMERYRRDLAAEGLEAVIFGHIGDNHVHVNILPADEAQYARGREVTKAWALQAVAWGGSVSAEHGIGKLKTALLAAMYGPGGLAAMHALKRTFDPGGRLNPGTLLAPLPA